MNAFVREHLGILQQTMALRGFLLDALAEEDLDYSPGGDAPTFRDLLKDIGQTQQSYIDSYTTLKHDYAYQISDTSVVKDIPAIRAWFNDLDAKLLETLNAQSDEDLMQMVDRVTFQIPLVAQGHVFKEALMIFYGAANMYIKALGKQVSGYWHPWIG